jgi:hypothetical protein
VVNEAPVQPTKQPWQMAREEAYRDKRFLIRQDDPEDFIARVNPDGRIEVGASFFDNPEQFKKACHYTNLQPLWAEDNLKKSNR